MAGLDPAISISRAPDCACVNEITGSRRTQPNLRRLRKLASIAPAR